MKEQSHHQRKEEDENWTGKRVALAAVKTGWEEILSASPGLTFRAAGGVKGGEMERILGIESALALANALVRVPLSQPEENVNSLPRTIPLLRHFLERARTRMLPLTTAETAAAASALSIIISFLSRAKPTGEKGVRGKQKGLRPSVRRRALQFRSRRRQGDARRRSEQTTRASEREREVICRAHRKLHRGQ